MAQKRRIPDEIASAPDLGKTFVASVRAGLNAALGPGAEIDIAVTISASRESRLAIDTLAWPFWIVARFRGRQLVGEIAFGDRDWWLRASVRSEDLASPEEGYAFWEWAAALGQHDIDLMNTTWCTRPDRVAKVVMTHTEWLATNASVFRDRGATLAPSIAAAREERAAAYRAAEHGRQIDAAVAAACAAFRHGDNVKVVSLLAAYESELSEAAVKLLGLARLAT